MDLVCWECEHSEWYLRYEDGNVVAQCAECANEEVLV